MNAATFSVEFLRMVREVRKLRARGLQYKQIDDALNLPDWDTSHGPDSFSYHLLREVNRTFNA